MKIDDDFKSALTGLKIRTRHTRGRTRWEQLPEIPQIGAISISLGNPSRYGDRLLTLVEWRKQFFQNIQFHIVDTPYRHNYEVQFSLSDKEAKKKAENEGSAWIEQHSQILSNHLSETTYSFVRGQKWLDHLDFQKNREIIQSLILPINITMCFVKTYHFLFFQFIFCIFIRRGYSR